MIFFLELLIANVVTMVVIGLLKHGLLDNLPVLLNTIIGFVAYGIVIGALNAKFHLSDWGTGILWKRTNGVSWTLSFLKNDATK